MDPRRTIRVLVLDPGGFHQQQEETADQNKEVTLNKNLLVTVLLWFCGTSQICASWDSAVSNRYNQVLTPSVVTVTGTDPLTSFS